MARCSQEGGAVMTGSPMCWLPREALPLEEILRQNVDLSFLLELPDNDADIVCSHLDGLC
jgi:hypothetical protein